MFIKFFSDGSVTNSGFMLTYEAVDEQPAPTPETTPQDIPVSTTGSVDSTTWEVTEEDETPTHNSVTTTDYTTEAADSTTSNYTGEVCPVNDTTLSAVVYEIGYLMSPNYPSDYYNNANCRWIISSASNLVVKVTVLVASLEINYDYVEIFDGMSASSPLLVRFYGIPNDTVYYSSGQHMFIKFFSDGSVTNSGFMLTYEAVDEQPAPTPETTPQDIPVTTTDYFTGSVDSTTWEVTEEDETPTHNSVTTTDHTTEAADSTTSNYTSEVCPVNDTTLSAVVWEIGYLMSPNYPSDYYNNANCRWIISSASNLVVKVTVLVASLEINYDYVEIFDGMSASSPLLVRFYGIPNDTVYYSSGQHMFIKFFSDGSVTNSGFMLTYEAVDEQPAPTPETTPQDIPVSTTDYFTGSVDSTTWEVTEEDETPTHNSVTTTDHTTDSADSTTSKVTSEVCPVNDTTLSAVVYEIGYLMSPNYPSDYYNNANCRWIISSASNLVVKVTVLVASMEINYDYVEIFDGMSASSPLLVRFYGIPNDTVYYSSGQHMFIKFFSDGSVTNSGFMLTYEAVDEQPAPTPDTTPTATFVTTTGELADMQVIPSTLRLSGVNQSVQLTCSIPSTATVQSVYVMTMSRITSSQPYQEQTLAFAGAESPQATLVPASEGGLPANSATVSGGVTQKSIQVILRQPDCKDAGVYHCSIMYNSGTFTQPDPKVLDESENLTVTVPPGNITISVSPDNEINVANTTVELLCNAVIGVYDQATKNTEEWTWEFNDKMYGWRTYTKDSDIRKDTPIQVPGTCYYRQVCYLTLLLTPDDSKREYRCSVENNGDKDSASLTLGIVNEDGIASTQTSSTESIASTQASSTESIASTQASSTESTGSTKTSSTESYSSATDTIADHAILCLVAFVSLIVMIQTGP
ncbi:deleted in malignant brain tumors 1 protein-like isoform X2 [Pomacea canaliculata]|uniref:deleted in malignant brain tumors 1 protein-like isoform X2 n=1 Tax=Pomacea canaliculata TaxID=400727 RepID=UPI000D7291AD|nr:deleted in malignant brain tumors 1 protein-like isoform X2 [Pomacea canaliculata]